MLYLLYHSKCISCCVYCTYAANQTRKFSAPYDTEVQMPAVDDEYVMLKDATCMQDISKSYIC